MLRLFLEILLWSFDFIALPILASSFSLELLESLAFLLRVDGEHHSANGTMVALLAVSPNGVFLDEQSRYC